MNPNERLKAFENMLDSIQTSYTSEKQVIDQLKAQGKDKSATYKHYVANRLTYNRILSLYSQYGLID